MLVLCALLVFQPIAIYYAFQAYKEFKGALMDNGGGGMGGLSTGMVGRAANTTGTSATNARSAGRGDNENYNGNGTAFGGGQANQATVNTSSNFNAFSGAGTRLG